MQSEETWMELHVLHRHGWSIAALAREFGLDWRTAKRYADREGHRDTGHERDRPSFRPPRSPTSSAAWRPARTSGRPSSCASSCAGYGYTRLIHEPAPAGRRAPAARERGTRSALRDRARDPDPGRLDRRRDLAARRGQRRALRLRRRSSATRGCRPSASRPTRRGRRPSGSIVRCVDDLGGASAEFLTDRDTALMTGSPRRRRPDLRARVGRRRRPLGTRPRACRAVSGQDEGQGRAGHPRGQGGLPRLARRAGPAEPVRPSPTTTPRPDRWASRMSWLLAGTGRRSGSSARRGREERDLLTPVSGRLLRPDRGHQRHRAAPASVSSRQSRARWRGRRGPAARGLCGAGPMSTAAESRVATAYARAPRAPRVSRPLDGVRAPRRRARAGQDRDGGPGRGPRAAPRRRGRGHGRSPAPGRLRFAHYPLDKRLEQFEFDFQPSIDRAVIAELSHAALRRGAPQRSCSWDRPGSARPISRSRSGSPPPRPAIGPTSRPRSISWPAPGAPTSRAAGSRRCAPTPGPRCS